MDSPPIAGSVPFVKQNLAIVAMNGKFDQLFMPDRSVNWAGVNVIGVDGANTVSVDEPSSERCSEANRL
jgi:hypothetical protein